MKTTGRVPKGETGESGSKGMDQGIRMPKPLGHNVLTESGRHFKNSRTANVGTIRGGQEATGANGVGTGYNQKSGAAADSPIRSMAPKPTDYFWTNQAETSKGGEAAISGPATPFRVEGGVATLLPGSVKFAEQGIGYEYISDPGAPLSKRGYGVAPQTKTEIEAAASVDGMPSKGYNPINGGRASWMRKD